MDSPTSSTEDQSLYELTSDLTSGVITFDNFLKMLKTSTITAHDVPDCLTNTASCSGEDLATKSSAAVVGEVLRRGVNLKDVSFDSVANFRQYTALKELINAEAIDVNARGEGNKNVFTLLMEQYKDSQRPSEVASDEDFLRFLVSKKCVRGLEGELGNLFLYAMEERNHDLLPGGYDAFKASFGHAVTYNKDGILDSLVNLFGDNSRMENLLKKYESQNGRNATELRLQLNETYKTFTAASGVRLPERKYDDSDLETEEAFHTPDHRTVRQEELVKLSPSKTTPDRSPGKESRFSAISPSGHGEIESDPGTEIKPSRNCLQKLWDCITKGGR